MANKKSRALEEFEQFSRDNRDRFDEQTATKKERQGSYQRSYQLAERQVAKNKKTAQRSQVMMQGFHRDAAKQAQSELEYAVRHQQNNANLYSQMGRYAAEMGDVNRYNRAEAGYNQSAGAIDEAVKRYSRVMDDYNEKARKSNPGLYYASSMSQDDINDRLQELERAKKLTERAAGEAAWMRRNDPDRAKVYSSEDGDGKAPHYAKLTDQAQDEYQRVDDEIATYQSALEQRKLWDNTAKYEEFVGAFTKDGQLTPEAKALAEQGKAAYERDNGGKRSTSPYANYGYASMAPSYQTDLRLGSAHDQERRSRQNQDTDSPHYAKTYEERGVDDGYLSEDQKQLYYALYARDPEVAREYLTLAQEKAENDYFQRVSDVAGKNFLTQWYGMQGAAVSGLLSGLDPYGEFGQALSKTSEAITRGGAQAWNEVTGTFDEDVPILGGKGLGDLYGLGVSMIESGIVAAASSAAGNYGGAAAKVVEFLGTALMGSSASASDYRECLQRGMTKDQAATHGLAAGIAEAAFEYISIDKLVNQDVTRGLVKNFFVQGGIEASEEVCTSVANRVTDALLARAQGYDTKIEQRVKELLAMGVDRREAERKAEQEWLTEVINDGIGGFLSGGLMTVGRTVGSWNEYRAAMEQNRMEGQMTRQSGQTDALRQYAEANDLGWYGEEIDAEAVKSGVEPVQNAETGERIATPPSEARNDSQKQTRQEKRQERQAQREQKRQLREQSKQDRQIGSDTQRVQAHIQEQFSGKSIQEQTALRDQMIEQYGNGIAPAVYEAISVEAAKKAAGLKGADEIRAARDQAVSETQDRAMKRAIADGYDQAVFGQAMRSGNADEAGRYFQQLRNTGEGGMTLEATVKDQDGQSRQIAITGMTEDGKGVKLADGSTVAVSKLQADADTMDAVQRISELEMGADADAVLQAYIKADKSGVDGYRWLMDYSLAYEQGRTGKLSLEEAVKRSSLDQRTVLEAYTLGQRNAHQETRSAVEALKAMPRKAGITGKTSNIDTSEIEGITLNESEREQFEFANKIFSLIGVDVKWKASAVQNGRFVGANGSYLNGVVTLDVHAGRNFLEQINSGILATTGHELTHFLQQYAPEQYQALKEFLFRQIVQSSANGETRLERLIWEKQRRASSKLSRKAAEDEVVADACQTMLRDSKAVREFAQQDEEAAKGIARWLDKWLSKLKQAFSRSAQLTEEARFVDSFAKEVREAFGKLWDEALREAVETHDRVGNINGQQGQNSVRPAQELYQTEFDFTEPMTTDEFRKLIKQENDASKYFPKGLSEDFMKAITKKALFTKTKLYRGIDASEFDFLSENGFIKSNSSYNFANQQDQTLADESAEYALSYATGFAPREIADRHYKDGMPSYLIEFVNASDLNMKKNNVQESYTYGNIDQKYITRVFEIMYDPETENDMIQDVTNDWYIRSQLPQLGSGLSDLAHGLPEFVRDRTTGTILYAVQGEDGWENGTYISEKFPGAILDYGRIGKELKADSAQRFFGVSGNEADLEPMEIGKDGKLVPSEENPDIRYSEREDQGLRDRVSDLEEQLEFAELNGLSQTEIRKLNNELIKARGQLDTYTANQRRQVKRTSYNEILRNLENYERVDLESLAEQISDSAWDDYGEMSDEELIDALRETINERLEDFAPGEADNPKYGLWVKKPKTGGISMVRAAQRTNENNTRFSMRDPVEQTDRLIAWHNMNEDALRSALELGGLAMPSWAIKTADRAHTSYGKISVIAPRDLVDPKLNRSSMIFGGDAWTPVFPGVDYDVTYESAKKLEDEIRGLVGEEAYRQMGGAALDHDNISSALSRTGGTLPGHYSDSLLMKYAYLRSIGKDVTLPQTGERLDAFGYFSNEEVEQFVNRLVSGKLSLDRFRKMSTDELMQQEDLKAAMAQIREEYYREKLGNDEAFEKLKSHGFFAKDFTFSKVDAMLRAAELYYRNNGIKQTIDKRAAQEVIDKEINKADFEKWALDKLNSAVVKKGIRNEKDTFTPSGNRRSFDALHYAYNLANIVKAMKSQPKQGRTQFLSGPGSVKGAALKSYNTVDQVRKDRGRLVDSAEEGKEAYDAYNKNLEDILDRMSKNGDRFDAADALIEVFQHAKTEAAIYNYMQRELKDWYNISRELAHDAYELIGQINALPMEYFEGKTYDAVRFDETAAVVVPDNIDPALKQQLEDAGARVVEYAAGDDTDRLAKVNSVEGAQFSERDYSLPSDLELMDRAIEGLSEAGGEEYWKALLETDPGLAEDVKGYKDQARKLAAAEKRLADYKKQMQLGGNRKLNTRGITSLSLEMMKTLDASDAKSRGVAKQVAQTLTSAYQKALDAIDKGTSDADAWDIVYNEGVVPAAEIIAKQGTHSEKTGRGWITASLESYYGEGGMQAIIDTVAGYVGADFATNRYRKAIQPTIADRIVERTEKRMQKQIDAATERATEAERINKKLTEDRDFWKNQQAKDSETVTFLNERLKEARQDLRDNKSLSSQERRKLAARIKSLQTQLQAKREEIRALKSLSQQLDKQAVEFGQKQAKLLDKLEQQVQRERDILSGKLKPLGMQRLLKAEREKAEEKVKQHKEEVFRNYKDQQQQSKLRWRIKNLSDDMKRRMTNPSERAYVPASLYGSMTQLCDALDDLLAPGTGTKAEARYRAVMDKIHGLAAEYQAVKDLDDPTYSSEYDEEIQHEINELVKTLNGRTSTAELSTEELQNVYNIMKYINYCMTTAKDLMGSTQFKDVYSAMRSVVNQQQTITPLNEAGKAETAKRSRLMHKLSTMRAVEMMSGWQRDAALYQLMHAIEQGVADSDGWVMNYDKSMQALKTGKNELEYRRAISKKLDDYNVKDTRGNKVLMTKMQAIQILMTAEREAHNDKLVHLQKGGAVIRDRNAGTSYTIKVTPELIQKIQNSMTEWDRAYMKAVREYFQREGKRTNEILYRLKHRVLQTEEYYVPYNVDKNYLETKLDSPEAAMSMWVKTPGATNALAQKASQPVYIDGIDAVMGQHVREIANYIGMAIPIRDFSKVYNGMLKQGDGENPLPIKETIHNNYGDDGQRLLTQAIIDVQGGRKQNEHRTQLGKLLDKLQSMFYRKSLLINAGVTIKQAASYVAAESIVSHKALERGNHPAWTKEDASNAFGVGGLIRHLFLAPSGKTAQRLFNEIDEHTSIHYQRRQGMSMQELAQEANRSGRIKTRLGLIGAGMEQYKGGHTARMIAESVDPLNWIQRMDVATTAALWVACKEQAKLDGVKSGTQEYWNHVTELYERCIRETQPMYDTLHRSEDQKDRSGLMQYLFPFRTVPIQNHGQLAASFEAFKAAQKSGDEARIKQSGTFFRKTAIAQTMSAAVFAAFTLFAAVSKRKTKKYRDEDEELTLESLGLGVGRDIIGTLFSVFFPMFGSAAWDTINTGIDYAKSGKEAFSYDAFSIGVADMLNNLWQTGGDLGKDVIDLIAGRDLKSDDVVKHIGKMVSSGLECAGVPTTTAKSYWNGIKGNLEDIANGRIPALNDESWERATGVNAKRFYEAWEAGDEAKMQTVLNEVRQSGKSEDSIANAFNSYAKDAYENNRMSLEQYADYLEKTGMFDAEKISGKVKNLVRDEFQAGERSEDETISALTGICGMDADEAWKTVQRWEAGAEHEGEEDYSYSQYEDLREALDEGKSLKEAGAEYLAHGYTEEQIAAQAVSWLKDQVTAGKINENRAIQLLRQYKGMDADKAWKKVQEWKATAAHADDEDYSWSQYDEIDAAIDGNKDIKALVKQLTSHGVEEKSVTSHVKSYLIQRYEDKAVTESQFRNQLSRYCGIVAKKDVDEIVNNANCFRDSGYHYSELKTAYNAKELSGDKARQMLVKYGGLSKDEAKQKTRFWDFEVQHPDANLSIEKVNAYYDTRPANYGKTMEQAGISVQSYISYCQQASKAQGTDLNHDGRTDSGSKKAAVMRIIDGLNLTRSQKDALYYLNGWSPKTIYEAPWH